MPAVRAVNPKMPAELREKQILVLKTGIAGTQFHIENEEEQAALDLLTPGTELLLYPEPENEYDEWTIAGALGLEGIALVIVFIILCAIIGGCIAWFFDEMGF